MPTTLTNQSYAMKIELSIRIGREKKNDTQGMLPHENLVHAAKKIIDSVEGQKRRKTIDNYKTAIRAVERCFGDKLYLDSLTSNTMEQFAYWLRDQGICPNTMSCYMRSLRSLTTLLVGKELSGKLFAQVFTGNTRTVKRAVDTADIIRLKSISLPPYSYLSKARDLFLFCFYAQGIPFVDAVRLQWSQVSQEALTFYRHKNGQRVSVALDPLLTQIMQRYRSEHSDWVFPDFHPVDERDYQLQLNRYNRALKRLTELADIKSKLTSYVARHSWASMAYRANVDLPVISKALGHTNPQTTLIYVKEINDARLAQANRKLLDAFRQ